MTEAGRLPAQSVEKKNVFWFQLSMKTKYDTRQHDKMRNGLVNPRFPHYLGTPRRRDYIGVRVTHSIRMCIVDAVPILEDDKLI